MADVIEEYLVKIGYKSDKVGYKQSMGMVNGIGISALGAAGKIAKIGLAVTAATTAFAYNMRKMYFASELAGSSVQNLKAVGFAGKQAGVSSESMAASVQNFARAIRTNPGITGFLKSIGVKVEGRDMSDVLLDTVDAVNNMKIPQGAKEGLIQSYFGMSGDDFFLLSKRIAETKTNAEEARQIFKDLNVNQKEGEEVVMHYTKEMDKLGLVMDALTYKIGIKSVGAFDLASSAIKEWAKGFSFGIDNIESEWDKFSSESSMVKFFKWIGEGTAKGVDNYIAWGEYLGILDKAEASTTPAFSQSTGAISSAPTGKKKTRAERNNNPGNIEYGAFAMAQGAIGSDGRFAIFPDLETGYQASRNLLSSYGEKGINTVSGVISKWAPSSENNTGSYASYVANKMGVGTNEQLNMSDPVILGQLSKYIGQYEGMPSGATITQTNNFNITGTNAEQIAQEVVTKNDRASADLNRYTKSAYR